MYSYNLNINIFEEEFEELLLGSLRINYGVIIRDYNLLVGEDKKLWIFRIIFNWVNLLMVKGLKYDIYIVDDFFKLSYRLNINDIEKKISLKLDVIFNFIN